MNKMYLTDTLPENVVMKIGKSLLADQMGTYEEDIYCRITDTDDGYYIICGLYKVDYEQDKQAYDDYSDIQFKVRVKDRVILEAGRWPKHDTVCFFSGEDSEPLSFTQWYHVMNMLKNYIIKEDDFTEEDD